MGQATFNSNLICLIYKSYFIILSFSLLGRASTDGIYVPVDVKQPRNLLVAFKGLLSNNYPAACLALGGTIMSLVHQQIILAGGSCPVVILTGDTKTSKTTVLKVCVSITGNSEAKSYSFKEITMWISVTLLTKYTFIRCC